MIFKADTEALRSMAGLVSKVARSKLARTNPLLACLRMVADSSDRCLKLSGGHGDAWLCVTTAQVDVQHPGDIAVSAEQLCRAIDNCGSSATVTVDLDGHKLNVRGDSSITTLYTHKSSEMPPAIELGDTLHECEVSVGDLCKSFAKTEPWMLPKADGSIPAGVRVRRHSKSLEFVGTDRRGCCLVNVPMPSAVPKDKTVSMIIPDAGVALVRQAFSGCADADQMQVRMCSGGLRLVSGDIEMRVVPVDGQFIAVEDHLPTKRAENGLEFDVEAMASAVRGASMFNNEYTRSIKLTPNGKSVAVSGGNPEHGEFVGDVDAKVLGSVPELHTNGRFLLQSIRDCGGVVATLEVGKTKTNLLAVRSSDGNYVAFWTPLEPPKAST